MGAVGQWRHKAVKSSYENTRSSFYSFNAEYELYFNSHKSPEYFLIHFTILLHDRFPECLLNHFYACNFQEYSAIQVCGFLKESD